jgi:hypothetical protein
LSKFSADWKARPPEITTVAAASSGRADFDSSAIDTLSDIGRLFTDTVQHGTGMAIETQIRAVITDIVNGGSDQRFEIDPGGRGNFTGNGDKTGFDHGFAGDACFRILFQNSV